MFEFGLGETLAGGVQPGSGGAGLAVLALQFRFLLGESVGRCVARLGGGCGERLAYDTEAAVVLGRLLVGALVDGEGALLRLPVDVSGDLPCGRRVFGGAADGAGISVDESGGEFRGDAVESLFLQVEPASACVRRVRAGGEGALVGVVRVPGELVALAGGPQPGPRGVAPHGQLLGAGRGLLRGPDALLETGAGGLPGGEPALGVLQDVLVGALLAVQAGALLGEFTEPALGPAGRGQAAQFLGRPARVRREPGCAGVGEGRREGGTRVRLGHDSTPVLGLAGVAQVECGCHRLGLAAPLHAGQCLAVGVRALLQPRGALPRLGEPALQPGHFPYVVEFAVGGGLRGLGGRDRAVRDGQPLAGRAAGDGGPGQDGLGEARFAGREVGQRHLGDVPGGLLHAVGVGEQRGVPVAHLGLGCAPAFAEALLDLGEALGVEEAPEELAAGLGVGPQEAGEVALGQQYDLTELFTAHAEQLGDLLADLLVGTAEVLPGARRTLVLAQPALGLFGGRARAALLRTGPGGCRVISSRRPATVSSRRISVRVAGAAWSLRRVRPWPLWRAPGTAPYSA